MLVEHLLFSNYIKYDKLKDLINESFKGSDATEINVIIDMYSICKSLYRNNIEIGNIGSILTSGIINMVAHYRHFFRNYYGTESTFYIINSINCPMQNISLYMNYNKSFRYLLSYKKDITDFIKSNIDILNLICRYIPETYFINTDLETGVIINEAVIKHSAKPNIVITKDQYNYQLSALYDNVVILRPKKIINEDISYYINKKNVLPIYFSENNNKYKDTNINPELLSCIMTLSSLSCRDIKKMFTRPKAVNILQNLIEFHYLLNAHSLDYHNALSKVMDEEKLFIFNQRFNAIDILKQSLITPNIETRIRIQPYKHDPRALQHLNNTYFSNNPLDLNKL